METAMNEITLAGCTPTPLAGYLKALGVFRLVAEQKDAEVKACWQDERFALVTKLSREELTRFFLEEYQPTPILSPWNGRAGYLEGEDADDSTRRGAILLRLFRESKASRLSLYRDLIQSLDKLAPLREMNEVRATKKALDKDKKENPRAWSEKKQSELATAIKREAFLKEQLLNLLRNALPDDQLAWLDAAVAIGAGRAFAPLLGGSGGVEGSMDLGVNFMDNLLHLFAFDNEKGQQARDSAEWLGHALRGENARLTAKNTAGSLSPGRVGGHNATSGFSQYLSINPWDFILMIEGAVAFKPSLTRKLESATHARMSYPFTVEPSAIGAGAISTSDSNKTRAGSSEMWMPLWPQPASYFEVITLLREGSIRMGAKQPKDGFDMARCIAKLGMDRGIQGFQRYLFLKRSGDNDLAVPLSRFNVSRNGAPGADLIADLDQGQFLDRLRHEARDKDAPASLKRAVAQLENALFALTQPGTGRASIQRALILLGDVMQTLAASRKGREAVPVLPRLSAAWVMQAADDSAEFRLALALASLHRLRPYLAPVERTNSRWEWAPDSHLCVWGKGDLIRNLVRMVERRVIETRQSPGHEAFLSHARLGARLSDLQAFLSNQTDDELIAALLLGLIWVDLPAELPATTKSSGDQGTATTIPMAYAICKPFFTPPELLKHLERLPRDASFSLPGELPRQLAADQIEKAIPLAWRRGQIAGLGWPRGNAPQSTSLNGPRLLAALSVPLQSVALLQLLPRAEDLQPESV